MEPNRLLALAWYRAEQWDQLREVSVDKDELEDTYLEWVMNCNKAKERFAEQGLGFTKVDVDVDELVEFSKRENMPIDSKARSLFVAWKCEEADKERNS